MSCEACGGEHDRKDCAYERLCDLASTAEQLATTDPAEVQRLSHVDVVEQFVALCRAPSLVEVLGAERLVALVKACREELLARLSRTTVLGDLETLGVAATDEVGMLVLSFESTDQARWIGEKLQGLEDGYRQLAIARRPHDGEDREAYGTRLRAAARHARELLGMPEPTHPPARIHPDHEPFTEGKDTPDAPPLQ